MSRTLTVAGLLIDSWRDQFPQMEPSGKNLPGYAIPTSRFRDTSDDLLAAPRLTSLIELAVTKRDRR
jgi:hypothetical protein